MKKFLLPILIASLSSCRSNNDREGDVVIGKKDSLYSNTLKEMRHLQIYLPESATHSDMAPIRYPVIYLLDGESFFITVSGLVRELYYSGQGPEMIVIAIDNTDRFRDLTPTHSTEDLDGTRAQSFHSTGGGENFTSFITNELIPYVAKKYPASDYKMLIGYSMGGLFSVNAMLHHPKLFNSIICIDPSLWWHRSRLLHEVDSAFGHLNFDKQSFFLSAANTLPAGMDTITMKKDTSYRSIPVRSVLNFAHILNSGREKNLRFAWKYYPDENHGSVPLASQWDGLRFIFDSYKIWHSEAVTSDELLQRYRNLSDRLGYELPLEATADYLGQLHLAEKEYDQAYTFFDLNVKKYPESFSAINRLGQYYLQRHDTSMAIKYFERALTKKDRRATRKTLEQLKR
jgi:predicted alpha/beta superfamily hydrolase